MGLCEAMVVQQYRARGCAAPIIAYDADDVLWPLLHTVACRLGLEPDRCMNTFSIRENKLLSTEEQEKIIAAFADSEVFRGIEFFPGTADILRPTELGAKVVINSNAFTEEIAQLKHDQLLAAIPGLRDEDIHMNVIGGHACAKQKKFDPQTAIVVDDSPFNIAMSPALINVMPQWMIWSRSPDAVQRMLGKRVAWRRNLIEINKYVYAWTKVLLCK